MIPHSPSSGRLADLIARSRADLFGGAGAAASENLYQMAAPLEAPALPTPPPEPSPVPLTPSRPSCEPRGPVSPRVLPTLPSAAEVRAGLDLSGGALALWAFLHEQSRRRALSQSWPVLPSHDVFHLPAVIVAAALGYSERHTYRLADELRVAGLIDARGHVAQVGKLRRYSGTLWAVKLRPTAPRPRLRWWDFRHDWRPDFADEYHGEQGAWREVQAIVSEPLTHEGQAGRFQALATTWAVASRTAKTPVAGGSDIRPGATLRAVARALPALIGMHPRQRHRAVSRLAADLAHALNEPGRFRQWAGAIYAALTAENEQRPGLEALALQVERLAVDLAEGAPWRRAGAVLAARLRG